MSDSSDKELEMRLLEAGQRLLGPLPSNVLELLHLLYKLFNSLKEVEQTHHVSVQNAVSQLKMTLIAERLFNNSDVDVRVAVTACITEVMRISAPVAPYDDEKMREVLQLIVSSVEHLDEEDSLSNTKKTSILDTVAKCKTYLAEAVKSPGVPLEKSSNGVAFTCEGAFSDLKQNKVVAHKKVLVGSSGRSVSKSKKPLEETSDTNTKRRRSLAKEKASDYEKLVGSRIKVWWPMDQAYYKGVVHSYNSSKKKHLVCYEDGGQEVLNLKKQKWYFVDESESSEDQGANQTGRDEEASTMSQKKKAKTGKAQSANKQSKMDISLQMLSPIPPYAKKDDEAPQVSQRCAEQALGSCTSQLKTYEAVKLSRVSIDKHNNVVDSACDGAFNALEQVEVIANKKEDRQGPREAALKEDKQKTAKVSTPEPTCVHKRRQNLSRPHEEDPAETETPTHKRARVQSCSLHKAHGEMEKNRAAEGEPSCRTHKSSLEPEDPQHCSVTHQLAKVKHSIMDTITRVRQIASELETKEQSSVRQFRSEIKKKLDDLEASLQEVDVLGEKISGINS